MPFRKIARVVQMNHDTCTHILLARSVQRELRPCRSARTLYSQQGVTALDAHGAADAAAAAAGQLMASQAEEEAPVEGGTQEPLPDEAFPQVD